jgi:ribosomal protein S18 acetylase RimI-like enzyme
MEIVRLEGGQLGEATAVLARAFHDDPAWCWVVPNAKRRAALLPWLFEMAFEVTEGEAWATAGKIVGCARWLPPGRPNVNVRSMLRAFVATPLRTRESTSRFLAYGRAVEAMRADAVPEPHWYLAGIGVEPSERGRGIGSALIAPGIEASLRDHIPSALLTNSEANLPFYERHGFEVVREGRTPAAGPLAWMMRRKASSPEH